MTAIEFYKNLADETRLRAIMLISQETELCVCELMTALDVSQPKISRHLALLRKSGVLVDSKKAQWVYYRINPELPIWMKEVLNNTVTSNQALIELPSQRLSKMGDRPERQATCC